ncbi:hypothetical protein [uncultured Rhodoblastus sp.]|uniref:hypothetical protein n=1 Tax=uncultured Rhodoblastus sp. TaxID=543037 RepID=UPI0025FE9E15|nr:hypothetical protein [uncultured Rhodoblastus sp.]
MPFAGDFLPPVSPGEALSFSMDFVKQIATGDSLVTVSTTLTVHSGTDALVASRLVGNPAISGTVVSQVLEMLAPGVTYNLVFSAVTANGATIVNFGRVSCTNIDGLESGAGSGSSSSAASVSPASLAVALAGLTSVQLSALASAIMAAAPASAISSALGATIAGLPTSPTSGVTTLWSDGGIPTYSQG